MLPFAIPFYTPDTGWGGGAFLLAYRDVMINTDEETNRIGFSTLFTQNNQKSIGISPDMILTENFRFIGKLSYSNSSSDFLGYWPFNQGKRY